MASSSRTAKSGGLSIPMWVIALIVVAAAIVVWRLGSFAMAARSGAPTVRTDVPAAAVQNPAQPGTERHKMYEEK